MPGARRGALPLAVLIVALLATGVGIAVVRSGDETPRADETPSPTFTMTTVSPTDTGATTTPGPTGTTTEPTTPSPTETTTQPTTASPSPTGTSGTTSPTTIPPTTVPTALPTVTGGDMPKTGGEVGGWLFWGLALMLVSTALMRAVTRRPA